MPVTSNDITSDYVQYLAISSTYTKADVEENLKVCYSIGQGCQTGRLLSVSVWMGSTASRLEALQLETKADARVGFCCESHHHWKQNKRWQDWSEKQNGAVSGDKNYDLSHSLVRLGTKEVATLNWGNRNLPLRIFRASPSMLVHASALFIELILVATFNK